MYIFELEIKYFKLSNIGKWLLHKIYMKNYKE